jgi:molybdopterin-binding protein
MQYARAMAKMLQAGEAARSLGISLDTLRRWDRQGRIRVQRDAANRRVVPVAEVERLRGKEAHALSARNRVEGVVHSVQIEGLLAQVEIEATERARFVAVITRDAAEALGLKPGVTATAVVKATSVMVER